MKVNNNFADEALRAGQTKKKFVFSWHNHVTGEQSESKPVEMTPEEAQETFRRAVMNSFSPFETRSFREVK